MASHFGIFDEKKNAIWVLIFGECQQCKTGFAVTEFGHIMTTAHLFESGKKFSIKARRLDQETISIAELVEIRPDWNLAMFKVNKKTPFVEFPSSGNLSADQALVYIGHPSMAIGCCLYGRVSFPVPDKVTLPTHTLCCKSYQSTERLTSRVLGDIYNAGYFYRCENKKNSDSTKFMEGLHPLVPIIQANGFLWKDDFDGVFGGVGFEGGPVFDCRGQVVGMMFTEEGGCQIGIHMSLLKHFMGLCDLSELGNQGKAYER